MKTWILLEERPKNSKKQAQNTKRGPIRGEEESHRLGERGEEQKNEMRYSAMRMGEIAKSLRSLVEEL
jgi:dihydrodipicolinate reductase